MPHGDYLPKPEENPQLTEAAGKDQAYNHITWPSRRPNPGSGLNTAQSRWRICERTGATWPTFRIAGFLGPALANTERSSCSEIADNMFRKRSGGESSTCAGCSGKRGERPQFHSNFTPISLQFHFAIAGTFFMRCGRALTLRREK